MTEEKQTTGAGDEAAAFKQSVAVIGAELCRLLNAVAPAEAQLHFKKAHVEALKGLRVLIDTRIERMTPDPDKGTPIDIE